MQTFAGVCGLIPDVAAPDGMERPKSFPRPDSGASFVVPLALPLLALTSNKWTFCWERKGCPRTRGEVSSSCLKDSAKTGPSNPCLFSGAPSHHTGVLGAGGLMQNSMAAGETRPASLGVLA